MGRTTSSINISYGPPHCFVNNDIVKQYVLGTSGGHVPVVTFSIFTHANFTCMLRHILVYQKVCEALSFLLDNIYIKFGSKLYIQILGIPMGSNCALLVADLFSCVILWVTDED